MFLHLEGTIEVLGKLGVLGSQRCLAVGTKADIDPIINDILYISAVLVSCSFRGLLGFA